jgi:hypothetical protein
MRLAGPVSNKSSTYEMDAITNAVNALVEEKVWLVTQENKAHVERLKKEEINVRNARAAAVAWRMRYDEMLERAERAERELVEEFKSKREQGQYEYEERDLERELYGGDDAFKLRCIEMHKKDKKEKAEKYILEESEQPDEDDEGETVAAVTQPLVTTYEGINYPTVSTAGPDIEKLVDVSYEEALARAVELNCSVMVKKLHGNTWYLRAQGIAFETLKKNIDGLSKQKLEPGSRTRTLYLIKY